MSKYGKYILTTTPKLTNYKVYIWRNDPIFCRLKDFVQPDEIKDIPEAAQYTKKRSAAAAYFDKIEDMDPAINLMNGIPLTTDDLRGEFSCDDEEVVLFMKKKLEDFPGVKVEFHEYSEIPASVKAEQKKKAAVK